MSLEMRVVEFCFESFLGVRTTADSFTFDVISDRTSFLEMLSSGAVEVGVFLGDFDGVEASSLSYSCIFLARSLALANML